jgi:hypothetical protein
MCGCIQSFFPGGQNISGPNNAALHRELALRGLKAFISPERGVCGRRDTICQRYRGLASAQHSPPPRRWRW